MLAPAACGLGFRRRQASAQYSSHRNICEVKCFRRTVRMHLLSLDSTSLARGSYDPLAEGLVLVFRDRSAYRYFGVPNVIFENLRKAPSKGAYFNVAIRGAYGFQVAALED